MWDDCEEGLVVGSVEGRSGMPIEKSCVIRGSGRGYGGGDDDEGMMKAWLWWR
jgi:hypothetical protein